VFQGNGTERDDTVSRHGEASPGGFSAVAALLDTYLLFAGWLGLYVALCTWGDRFLRLARSALNVEMVCSGRGVFPTHV
jgi:hypothetical protein